MTTEPLAINARGRTPARVTAVAIAVLAPLALLVPTGVPTAASVTAAPACVEASVTVNGSGPSVAPCVPTPFAVLTVCHSRSAGPAYAEACVGVPLP